MNTEPKQGMKAKSRLTEKSPHFPLVLIPSENNGFMKEQSVDLPLACTGLVAFLH